MPRVRLTLTCLASLVVAMVAESQPPRFQPVQPDTLSAAASFVNAWADVDLDGDADLFIGLNGAANRLYRNDAGGFTDVAGAQGVGEARATRAAAWGDADADGDPDLLLGFAPGTAPVLKLLRNDRGTFVDITGEAGLAVSGGAVRQPVWIDVDGDHDLDLFVAFRDRPNALFENNGGRFKDIAPAAGLADARKTVGAVWFDADMDNDLDLLVANMDGDANGLFRNDAGRFTDVAEAAGLAWGGRTPKDTANGTVRPCVADVNNDGRLDVFMANYGRNGLFLGRSDGTFSDVSAAWGVATEGRFDTCAFDDMDNDGHVDLYVNGTVTGGTSHPDYLFRNTGTRFDDVTPAEIKALAADHGAAWADADGDGDVDLALTGIAAAPMPLLWRNQLAPDTARRAVRVRVVDGHGRATRAGALVHIYGPAPKGADGSARSFLATRLVDAGSGYNAQNDLPVHIGLSREEPIVIVVSFPSGGKKLVAPERKLTVNQWRNQTVTISLPLR
jgi:hypothetical protein